MYRLYNQMVKFLLMINVSNAARLFSGAFSQRNPQSLLKRNWQNMAK